MPFHDHAFDVVVCFTMLHHIRNARLQDRLFAEAARVLRPGGFFAGSDSLWRPVFALGHLGDTLTLANPRSLPGRLGAARFTEVVCDSRGRQFRFRARAPLSGFAQAGG